MNNQTYFDPPDLAAEFAPWSWAKQVILFPSPLETHETLSTGSGNHSSTNIFDHFVAYVRGAAGLDGVAAASVEVQR